MPSGDAQRAWFPEMLTELDRFWANDPAWSEVIAFCERMTSLRTDIRDQRDIRSPMMMCLSCGVKHAMTLLPISPRSLLFALKKIDAITDEELKRLDKEWMRYRKAENLDSRGHRNVDGADDADDATQTSACH
ncbi:hypothetical protein [Stieleria varia]|uniref:Uncharacterized protein n=1 Tax=Stieleria varia TaxID=2528005 RepID=A0A5C6B2A5_9BACT|nr:hypothetical protein [Stieleria varia]TWU05542.1 hypothetical protein Pla52n_12560 [Stieleria varia]